MTTAHDIFELVSTASTGEITPVVQSIFGDLSAKAMIGWTVESLSSVSSGLGTLGLMRVSGKAQIRGEIRPWSSFLKIMDCARNQQTMQVGTPSREISAYRSGLFSETSTGFRSAKAHLVSVKEENTVWLWTEDLTGISSRSSNSWTAYQYLLAAAAIGRFRGHMLSASFKDKAWMNHNAGITRWTSPAMMEICKTLAQHRDSDYVRTALPGKIFDRVLDFESDILHLARAVEHIPMTLAHGDFHLQNMFTQLDHAGLPEIVAIDLASAGIEPLGIDIGTLIGSSLTRTDDDADTVMRIERVVFNAYVSGLRSRGCVVPEDTIRLGYLVTVCGYGRAAGNIPSAVGNKYGPWELALKRYKNSRQQLPYSYRRRVEFAVSMFDEALDLVRRLGYQ